MIVPVLALAVKVRGLPCARAIVLVGTGFQITAGLTLMYGLFIA
jgi:hypothetical protein